jgi:hypothetical protein
VRLLDGSEALLVDGSAFKLRQKMPSFNIHGQYLCLWHTNSANLYGTSDVDC